eukprot:gene19581-6773_t
MAWAPRRAQPEAGLAEGPAPPTQIPPTAGIHDQILPLNWAIGCGTRRNAAEDTPLESDSSEESSTGTLAKEILTEEQKY